MPKSTRFTSGQARRVLLAALLLTAAELTIALTPDPRPPFIPPPGSTGDVDLYVQTTHRYIKEGDYYRVAHEELLKRMYPTRSPFNWRLPSLTVLLGALPDPSWGNPVLAALSVIAFAVLIVGLARQLGTFPTLLGGIALFGGLSWCVGDRSQYVTDVWAGVLIALSVGLSARGLRFLGVTAGILAVGLRELALPFAAVSLAFAFWKRDWKETKYWAVGLALVLGYECLHLRQLTALIGPSDLDMEEGWIRFGGIRFILDTSRMNVFLFNHSMAVTAAYLTVALVGLYLANDEIGQRSGVIVATYLVAFSIAGAAFNFYWGWLIAPLLAVGFANGVAYLPSLLESALHGVSDRCPPPPFVGQPAPIVATIEAVSV